VDLRDIFVVLSVLVTLPLTLRWPYVGILAWCWLSYMNPHRLTWGFAYNLPLAMIVAVTTVVSWLLSKEPKRIPLYPATGFLLALAFWMSFDNLFAMYPAQAYLKWLDFTKILFMTFVTMALCGTRERLHAVIWVIVASLGFFALKGGVFTLLGGGVERVWGPPGSFLEDNNALAVATIMVLPLIRYLQIQTDQKLLRWGLFGLFVLSIFSIIGSSSRGAFLALSVVGFFLIMKSRHRLILGVGMIVMLVVLTGFVSQRWISRMGTIQTYQEDGSAMGRLQVWGFAIKLALDHPILGGGFRVSYSNDIYKQYVPEATHSRNFHSIYFEALGELGFPGLFIFLGLLVSAWRCGSSIIQQTRDREDLIWANDLARMLQISLVGYAVGGAFQNLGNFDLYYHLVAILILTQHVVLKSIQSSIAEQPLTEAKGVVSGAAVPRPQTVRMAAQPFRGPD
jgi:probable O-glycosylation ligase (exosortase A-associated)